MAVVDSVEETVQVTIRAFQSDWILLRQTVFGQPQIGRAR